jgi:hypothetical protein
VSTTPNRNIDSSSWTGLTLIVVLVHTPNDNYLRIHTHLKTNTPERLKMCYKTNHLL